MFADSINKGSQDFQIPQNSHNPSSQPIIGNAPSKKVAFTKTSKNNQSQSYDAPLKNAFLKPAQKPLNFPVPKSKSANPALKNQVQQANENLQEKSQLVIPAVNNKQAEKFAFTLSDNFNQQNQISQQEQPRMVVQISPNSFPVNVPVNMQQQERYAPQYQTQQP